MSGWIKIHRTITKHWLYTEKRKFSKFEAWQDMLLNVNYSDNKTIIKGSLYEVKRGQSVLSLDSWAKRWNWDKSAVRRFFNLLEKDNMITVKSDNTTTHLTICKYEDYQQSENANETQKKRKRNTDEIQTTPIKERKEKEERKEELYRKFKHLSLTVTDFNKLIELGYKKEDVDNVLDKIENYKNNNKYSSLYLTSKAWLKKDYKPNDNKSNIDYLMSKLTV